MPLVRLDALLLAALPAAWLLANHYPPWLSAWQDGFALALLLLAGLTLSRPATLPRLWALWGAVAIGSVCLQGWMGLIVFAGDVWIVVLYLVAFLLAIAAGSTLIEADPQDPAPRLHAFCAGLVLAATASVGIGLAQWAGVAQLGIFGADLAPGGRPFGNLAQANHWSTASFIGLAAALVLYEARRIGTATFSAAGLLLLLGMVASGSRTAWLQIALLTLLVLALRRQVAARVEVRHLALGLLFFIVSWLLWPWLNELVASAANARSVAEQAQGGVRLPLWLAMLDAIAERPLLGYGWQQMMLAQQAVALDGPLIQRHFEHAHNLALDLLIWAGVPAGATLLMLMGWALLRLLARARDARLLGMLAAIGGLLAHAMVELPAEYAYFLLPVGLLLGAAHRLVGDLGLRLPGMAMRASAGLACAALVLTGLDYLRAEQGYRMLRLESARIGTAAIETPAPTLRVLTQLEAFQRFARVEARPGLGPDELAFSRRVAERFAYPPAQFRHALAAGLNGQPEEAARWLAMLCRMHPPVRCTEAIEGWRQAQLKHPVLLAVPAPAVPGS